MPPPALVVALTPIPLVALMAPVPAPWPMLTWPEAATASMPSPLLDVTPAVSMVIVPAPRVEA